MKALLYFACLLLLVLSVVGASLTAMPDLNITDLIKDPTFNDAVNAYIAKYGTTAITFDAIIEVA
jgi:hypothetical protein